MFQHTKAVTVKRNSMLIETQFPRLLVISGLLFLLMGCVSEVSDEEFERQKNSPIETLDQISKELTILCNREDYKIIFTKSACMPNNITLAQLADNAMISEVEKTAFSKYSLEVEGIYKRFIESLKNYGTPKAKEFGSALERINSRREKNTVDLFDGKIAWGEYNKNRKDIEQSIKDAVRRIYSTK